MSEICLLSFFGQETACISSWILIGIALILIGILIAVFVPIYGKKIGFVILLAGLILAVGIPYFGHLWNTSQVFQMSVYAILTLIGVVVILFPDKEKK